MPPGKPYSVYVQDAEGMKPGTTVQVMGEGVVEKGGMVRVDAFTAEGGPNSADKQMDSMMGPEPAEEME